MIVSFPSGHRPGNRACLPPKKQTGPEKQTAQARKKQMPLLHGACLPPARKKTNAPSKEKETTKGESPLSSGSTGPGGSFFSPWPASHPGSAQEIVPACLQKKKQAQKNKPPRHEKNKFVFVFFEPASDGKLTIKFTCPKKY